LVQSLAYSWRTFCSNKGCSREPTGLLDDLGAVPNSVLVKIRQLIFSFLWSGCSERKRMHLCNWETIARPKKAGGWGLRNLFFFNKALAANTLWRVLTKAGIWHNVIKDKYLPYSSVSTWFRRSIDHRGRRLRFGKN
jgi:hypothetical protein